MAGISLLHLICSYCILRYHSGISPLPVGDVTPNPGVLGAVMSDTVSGAGAALDPASLLSSPPSPPPEDPITSCWVPWREADVTWDLLVCADPGLVAGLDSPAWLDGGLDAALDAAGIEKKTTWISLSS